MFGRLKLVGFTIMLMIIVLWCVLTAARVCIIPTSMFGGSYSRGSREVNEIW